MKSLPCFYFPTKVIFVDDEKDVLKSMRGAVNHDRGTYDFFIDPEEALKSINFSQISDFLESQPYATEDRITNLHQFMFKKDRFNEISTVVVDYQMPLMTGIEFCEKITNPYVSKVLYTGIADEAQAIQAFNAGLIDGYIKKQDPNQRQLIQSTLMANQSRYFKKLTDILVGSELKEMAHNKEKVAFYDQTFIAFFEDFLKKNQILEYYLNDFVGTATCLTQSGAISILYVVTDKILEEFGVEDNRKAICYPLYGKESYEIDETSKKHHHSLERVGGFYVAHVNYPGLMEELTLNSFEKFQNSQENSM